MDSFLAGARSVINDIGALADEGLNRLIHRLDQPIDLQIDIPQSGQEFQDRIGQIYVAAVGPSQNAEGNDVAVLRAAAETSSNFIGDSAIDCFNIGETVEVWSNSQKKWFQDGFVIELATTDTNADGVAIPAGSVLVGFGGGRKWVIPQHIQDYLRKPASPERQSQLPGSMLKTQVLAAARISVSHRSKDRLDELRSIELSCALERCAYSDPEFIGRPHGRIMKWCRPQEIDFHDNRPLRNVATSLFGRREEHRKDWLLFRGAPKAEDVQQGELGNCWFISSLAALTEFQGGRFVRMLFPTQESLSRCGAYLVRLCLGGEWRDIIVDDQLPCIGGSGYYTQLAYCSTSRLQIWASLVEKAFAKVCGSYEAIEAGHSDEALTILTGRPCKRIDFGREGFDADLLWANLSTCRDAKFLMTCSTGREEAAKDSVGLVPNHAYSLLDVVEVHCPHQGLLRLLKVRNPHAKTKWRGDWSETSPLWTKHLRDQVGYDEVGKAGVFCISLNDFLSWFESCTICYLRGSDWHEARIPISLPSCSIPSIAIALEVSETTECSMLLAQPEERARSGPLFESGLGSSACMGFVVICVSCQKQDNSAISAVAVGHMKCRSVVSADVWLQPDCSYILVPMSLHFGSAFPAVLACMSSKRVSMCERPIRLEAARAAWASVCRTGKPAHFHDTVVYTKKSSSGAVLMLAENRGRGFFRVEVRFESDPVDYYTYSRGCRSTVDWLAPGFGQLIQVALPDGAYRGAVQWNCQHKFSLSMFVPGGQARHSPELDQSGPNVHTPFLL